MNQLPELRRAFVHWLDPDDRSSSPVQSGETPRPAPEGAVLVPPARFSPSELLYALWDDDSPLPMSVVRRHDLPAEMTVSDLARVLYVHWEDGDARSLDVARRTVFDLSRPDLADELRRVRRSGRATA